MRFIGIGILLLFSCLGYAENEIQTSLSNAKWYGTDLFLEMHGGEDYKNLIGKQKIFFEESPPAYLGIGDKVFWINGRWTSQPKGNVPQLVLRKIGNNDLKLEVLVPGGETIPVILPKLQSTFEPFNINEWKFVSLTLQRQFIFQVKDNRLLLRPQDWLLFYNGAWLNLKTTEEIDNYIQGKTPGLLLVINKVRGLSGKLILTSTLFNVPRSNTRIIEFLLPRDIFQPKKEPEKPPFTRKKRSRPYT